VFNLNTMPRKFYQRDTVVVAKNLLGKQLVHKIGRKIISGTITETEAYRYTDDPASHSFHGKTDRNKAMFGQVGKTYVYFTYGMHHCMNVVARSKDFPAGAILIRSLEPQLGIKIMKKNRKMDSISNLTNGPAKLTQALQISKKQYGEDLTIASGLFITDGKSIKKNEIVVNPRVGIKKATDKLWNFKINQLSLS